MHGSPRSSSTSGQQLIESLFLPVPPVRSRGTMPSVSEAAAFQVLASLGLVPRLRSGGTDQGERNWRLRSVRIVLPAPDSSPRTPALDPFPQASPRRFRPRPGALRPGRRTRAAGPGRGAHRLDRRVVPLPLHPRCTPAAEHLFRGRRRGFGGLGARRQGEGGNGEEKLAGKGQGQGSLGWNQARAGLCGTDLNRQLRSP